MQGRQAGSKWTICALLMSLTLIVPLASVAQGKGGGKGGGGGGKPGSTETPVSITLRDALDDKAFSDTGAPYIHGQNGVGAVITGSGNLDFAPGADRSVFVQLSQPASGGQVSCADGTSEPCLFNSSNAQRASTSITLTVVEVCGSDTAFPGGLPAMAVGAELCGRMAYWFDSDLQETAEAGKSFQWTLRFRPGTWAASNNVTVRRTAADSWEVEAIDDSAASACPDFGDCTVLVRPKLTKKGGSGLIVEGYFRLPFLLTIVRLQ